ncbi:GNAT family N-acetyltransferase [Ekhidna sp.]
MSSPLHTLTITELKKDDLTSFKDLILLFVQVFEREDFSIPDSAHLEKLLKKDDFVVFCAQVDGKVVGGLTVYIQEQYYSTKPLAYIYDLAVEAQLQRQGIGKKLILAVNEYCQKHGFEEAYVPAEKEDHHAIDFYRSTKPTYEMDVIHFSYTLDQHKT